VQNAQVLEHFSLERRRAALTQIPLADRFFHASPIEQAAVSLQGTEAHHLIHVLRAKPGLEVTLFDGSGAEFLARVERVDRSAVQLAILERSKVDRESPIAVTLGVSMPKGDRQRWLIEKATELGVATITPLVTERSVAQPTGEALRRFERAVIEASKQCGRNRLMTIAPPMQWSDFVASASGDACLRIVAHPGSEPWSADRLLAVGRARQVIVAVGPEGGFTANEIQLALERHWVSTNLGPRILRVETAALALVTLCNL
jgi:16S rRNA (uracil1498-N3)-methyltransferase